MEENAAVSNEETAEKGGDGAVQQPEEEITDIQNYLASFNQEIADGTTVAQASAAGDHAILSTNDGDEDGEDRQTTTYYVAQTEGGTLQAFQYSTDQTPVCFGFF